MSETPTSPSYVADATVSVSSVSKWFGQKVAVSSLSCSFGPGLTGLLGPNGAGKTTLLRMLAGLARPSEGSITVEGRNPRSHPNVYRFLALVPEEDAVYGHMTGRELVAYSSRLSHRGHDAARVEAALADVELTAAADRPISSFSKGMRQKLGLAICLLKDTPALILDEPMAGLDPDAAADLVQTLIECRESGKAVLMATHDIFRTRELADRVGILRGGRKVFECSRDELTGLDLQATYLELVRNPGGNHTPGAASPES